ncbi:hypothetical protein ANO14919_139940 [Xylariales sp. No.14919]|nr:hypothetical protein ANO14919_139940 [Xylariales sp. No.14919]
MSGPSDYQKKYPSGGSVSMPVIIVRHPHRCGVVRVDKARLVAWLWKRSSGQGFEASKRARTHDHNAAIHSISDPPSIVAMGVFSPWYPELSFSGGGFPQANEPS